MAAHGRWLVPRLYGRPYFDKPAPFYAVLRAADRLPIADEAAFRLPSTLATLLAAAFLARFARRRFGERAALLGVAVFLTSPLVAVLGRLADPNALLAGAVTIATVAWLAWLDRPRGTPWIAWIAMGLGSMIKGPIAILLPLLVAAASALLRGVLPDRLLRARHLRGLALSVGAMLLWMVPAAIRNPAYIRSFLLEHNVARFVDASVGHPHTAGYNALAIAGGMLPWSLLLPVAALGVRARRSAARDARRGIGAAGPEPPGPALRPPPGAESAVKPRAAPARAWRHERDLLLWAGTIIGFFTLSRAKLATYMLPAVPPLALWLGARLDALASAAADGAADGAAAGVTADRWLRAALAAWAAILALAPAAGWIALRREHPALVPTLLPLLPLPVVVALLLRHSWAKPRRLDATALAFALGNVALFGWFALVGAPAVGHIASDRDLAEALRRVDPSLEAVGFRLQPAAFSYYSGRTVAHLVRVEDVRERARRGPLAIVSRRHDIPDLEAAGVPVFLWTPGCKRHCLFATFPLPGPGAGGDRSGAAGAAPGGDTSRGDDAPDGADGYAATGGASGGPGPPVP